MKALLCACALLLTLNAFGQSFLFNGLPVPEIRLEEQPAAYQIWVPIGQTEDAKGVQVRVESHRIDVTAQTSLRDPKSGQVIGQSRIQRSFMSPDELQVTPVEKSIRDQQVLITVRKKTPSQRPRPEIQKPTLPRQPMPKINLPKESFI